MKNSILKALPAFTLTGFNLLAAFLISSLFIMLIGESPIQAFQIMLKGALGSYTGIGYTLYYTTNLIFTGLAVAIALHCGLFNIGGEGQAYLGGLGVGLACLAFDGISWPIALLISIVASMTFGAAWAFIPGYLQAKRGSHIVITTIMFNLISGSLMVYLLVNWLTPVGQMAPESRMFSDSMAIPFIHTILNALGFDAAPTPLNITFILALLFIFLFWVYVWKTKWGYDLRVVGKSHNAALYAGISPTRNIIMAMLISGALAGLVGVNEILGVHHHLVLDFQRGFGFTGIAVALMGRTHPVGIFLSALLFGILYQGGAELAFEIQNITADIVVIIQGLVILFTGALEYLFRPYVNWLFAKPHKTMEI